MKNMTRVYEHQFIYLRHQLISYSSNWYLHVFNTYRQYSFPFLPSPLFLYLRSRFFSRIVSFVFELFINAAFSENESRWIENSKPRANQNMALFISMLMRLLDAPRHLYKRVCPSVRPSTKMVGNDWKSSLNAPNL